MTAKLILFLGFVTLLVVGGVYGFNLFREKTFTTDLETGVQLKDEIILNAPKPLQKINNPVNVSGKARGSWFFEGSFPAEVTDAKGNSLGTGTMQAEENSQTSEFVSFSGVIDYKNPSTATGSLILRNDNPSGIPENQKTLKIPITF